MELLGSRPAAPLWSCLLHLLPRLLARLGEIFLVLHPFLELADSGKSFLHVTCSLPPVVKLKMGGCMHVMTFNSTSPCQRPSEPVPGVDWLSILGGEGIEIVDSASHVKVVDRSSMGETARGEEIEPEPAQAPQMEKEEEGSYSKINDSVRMYLREIGSVSLLTREGEVEIAKRIKDGERRVLQAVLNASFAIEEILDLGDKLRQRKIRVNEVVKDADEDDAKLDENWHAERVCTLIEKIRQLHQDVQKVEDEKPATEAVRKRARNQAAAIKRELIDAVQNMRLSKKQIDRIVTRLKDLGAHIEAAQREIADCEQRAGMPQRWFRKTLREIRSSPRGQRAAVQELGLRPDELEDLA